MKKRITGKTLLRETRQLARHVDKFLHAPGKLETTRQDLDDIVYLLSLVFLALNEENEKLKKGVES